MLRKAPPMSSKASRNPDHAERGPPQVPNDSLQLAGQSVEQVLNPPVVNLRGGLGRWRSGSSTLLHCIFPA